MKKVSALLVSLFLCVSVFAVENVEALNRLTKQWEQFRTHTVSDFPGYDSNPGTDRFGGWKSFTLEATGYFRVTEYKGRWWYITPEGHPFISMAVATVNPGENKEQRARCEGTFGNLDKWADATVDLFRSAGLNSMGNWTTEEYFRGKFPYAANVNILKTFAKESEITLSPDKPQDKTMKAILNNPEFAVFAEKRIAKAVGKVGNDPFCMGWFIDNELIWDPKHPETLDKYLSIVTKLLKKHDPNHLFLGCRFNSWNRELSSPELMKVAGKYMDVVSVNHYNYWEPDFRQMDRIGRWSGRPMMVTEFYTKGEDSGMKNESGAGWVVHTQKDRGLFYQNFCLELLKSRACVGWQWFRYRDNDPGNTKADASNRDSNKGIVDLQFQPYKELLDEMSQLNVKAFALADSLYKRRIGGVVSNSSTLKGIAGVAVSDGYEVTLTNEEGRYSFPVDDRRQIIYITVPSGYEIPVNPATTLPAHYGGPDFKLTPLAGGPEGFDIIAIGDPQARNSNQVSRYKKETLADVQEYAKPGSLIFALGDIVSDSEPTWDAMFQAGQNLKASDGSLLKYFSVMGNHDSDRYDEHVDSSAVHFENYYGPRNFSIDRDGVHIVVMDDIFRTEVKTNKSVNGRTWRYKGGFSIEQYRWLLDDFEKVQDKENKTLVFLCHIPFDKKQINKRRDAFLQAFTQFGQVHILSGHNHMTRNVIYDKYICKGGSPIYDHTHVAAGGNVWFSTVAKDATPNGYAVYSFKDGNLVNWRFKGTGLNPEEQFRVYDGNAQYTLPDGEKVQWEDKLAGAFIVDLWNGDSNNWEVALYVKGKKVGDFERVEGKVFHPVLLRTVDEKIKSGKWWGSKDAWIKPASYYHLWYYVPKGGKPAKMKNWEIRARQTIPSTETVNVYTCSTITG